MDPRGFPTTLPEFQRVFPDDAACARYLEHLRWPNGFTCPKCVKHAVIGVVLGRIPCDDADARAICSSIPKTTRSVSLRNGVSIAPQATRRSGTSGARRYRRSTSG